VLGGGATSGALGVVAKGALSRGAALAAAEGSGLAGDLQLQVEVTKAKASIDRAKHERMKPPRGQTSSTAQTCPTSALSSWNLTAASGRDKTAGPSMPAFAPRRFLFITGKGGVGKTTVTAALARSLSARGLRVLVTACGAKERLSTLLGAPPLHSAISELAPNIWGVQLVSEVALREYGTMKLKNRVLVDAIFDSKYVAGFLSGTPGMKEWSLLGKAWFHATEVQNGRPRFDVVLFDAPATGHGLDMLRVPKVIVEIAPPGVLRSDAERAWEMFRDPAQSGVVVVTLPEEMPTNESLELCAALRNELTLPISEVVVNSLLPPLFSLAEARALEGLGALDDGSTPARAVLSSGVRRATRERIQSESLTRLTALGVPLRQLELLMDGAATPDAVLRLSRNFDA